MDIASVISFFLATALTMHLSTQENVQMRKPYPYWRKGYYLASEKHLANEEAILLAGSSCNRTVEYMYLLRLIAHVVPENIHTSPITLQLCFLQDLPSHFLFVLNREPSTL